MLKNNTENTEGVLIETYWNVKYLDADELLLLLCINRNILECKVL